jgi:imidazole glycerol-phosphate synthase subunit HisH
MIAVVDYRAGNLYSVGLALKHLGVGFVFTADPEVIKRAGKVILPGVGSARAAMDSLEEQGLLGVLTSLEVPFLGICLGLQLLFEQSEEDQTPCLGIVPGSVHRFDSSELKVPHIGWNKVHQLPKAPDGEIRELLFRDIPDPCYFYFVHSYYTPVAACFAHGLTEYGIPFASVVKRRNYWGVQFHPERSGESGLRLLQNFVELC